MGNFRMRSANATLTYGTSSAEVRVSRAGYTYGVTSTESHSRTHRAFYPRRRALGQFGITVDCNGFHEYQAFMNWLRGYTDSLLTAQVGDQTGAKVMEVQVFPRKFHKLGILSTGIDNEDHVGAALYSRELIFMTVKDFNDVGSFFVVDTSGISKFNEPGNRGSDYLAYYPATSERYKDVASNLYDAPTTISVDPSTVIIPSGPGSDPNKPHVNPGNR